MNALPNPSPGNLWLVIAPRAGIKLLLELAARLALQGRLRVLDGGNCFNAYLVARALGSAIASWPLASSRAVQEDGPGSPASPLSEALSRIQVARAFTCYQVVTLLGETPASPDPTLVLDLLDTFYDENVSEVESRRLLDTSLGHLRRLSALALLLSAPGLPPRRLPPGPSWWRL